MPSESAAPEDFDVEADAAAHYAAMTGQNLPLSERRARALAHFAATAHFRRTRDLGSSANGRPPNLVTVTPCTCEIGADHD